MPGTFPALTWNEFLLDKEEIDVDERGRSIYGQPMRNSNKEELNHLVLAEGILTLLSISNGEEDDDESFQVHNASSTSHSNGMDSTDLELKEILAVFRGVSTPQNVRKGMLLMFLFNNVKFDSISKYYD
jgi:hypothetical protein